VLLPVKQASDKKTIVRIFLALYVPVAVLLYFGLVYSPSRRAEKLTKKRDEIIASETHQTAISEAARIRDTQSKGLTEAIGQFYARSQGFDKVSVPVFVGRIARDTQVTLAKLDVASTHRVSGCTFFKAEVEMRGSFANLRAFLAELEENQKRFVSVDRARIGPARGTAAYALVATFNVMLRTMPTEGVLADAGGPPGQDTGGPAPPVSRQEAGPNEAQADMPLSGAPALKVSVAAHGS